MARAVNQTIAWIAALFLSLVVFGVGLAIVFSLKPKHKEDMGHGEGDHEATHGDQESTGDTEHHSSEHGGSKAPDHPADAETHEGKPKIEAEAAHSKEGAETGHAQPKESHSAEEDTEVTPESVKAKGHADEHTPEAKPHH